VGEEKRVGIAVVGCGYVASFYCSAIPQHPILRLAGVMDRNGSRSAAYAAYYSVPKYESLDDVLNDGSVELVVNLTNPKSHFAVSKACLESGKNVYSEKPLAMSFAEAQQLVKLAQQKGLYIASAPSRVLAETAQTLWKALREKAVGAVHGVYAEMDGGLIYRSAYKEWVNEVGMHWPYWDEFEVGCTIEHAGYAVSWLSAYFGPVESITAFATCRIPDLQADISLEVIPPDLTVACLKFKSGPVARLTSSYIAPSDHSLRIFGDTGVLSTNDVEAPRSPVYITRKRSIRVGPKTISIPWRKRYPLVAPPGRAFSTKARMIMRSPRALARALRARLFHLKSWVDFCLGPSELATAIRESRPCRLSPEYCLHNTEVLLAIHNSLETGSNHKITTSFAPMDPLPWALGKSPMARSLPSELKVPGAL
jgi:predicted dehydrogenase